MYMYSLGNAVELYTYLIANYKYGYLHQVRVGVGTYVMCVHGAPTVPAAVA